MTRKTLAALLVMFAFAGCGQSGPLYIPSDPSTIEPPPQQSQGGENSEEQDADRQ